MNCLQDFRRIQLSKVRDSLTKYFEIGHMSAFEILCLPSGTIGSKLFLYIMCVKTCLYIRKSVRCNLQLSYIFTIPSLICFLSLIFIRFIKRFTFYLVETQWPIMDDKMEISQMWTRLANKTKIKNAFACVTISSCVLL